MPEGTQYWCDAASTGELPLPDRGMEFGDGLFETLLCVDGKLLFPERHQVRLEQGFHQLGFNGPAPDLEALISPATEAIAQSTAAVLRLTLTRSAGLRGYAPGDGTAHRCVLRLTPLNHDPLSEPVPLSLGVAGIRLAHQPALAGIKHLNRLEQVLAAGEREDSGFDELLMLDMQGVPIATTAANIFIREGKTLSTPELAMCGIAGTRRALILEEWADTAGFRVQSCPLSLDSIREADEVFVCNSVIGVRSVTQFLDRVLNDHSAAAAIRQCYLAAVAS